MDAAARLCQGAATMNINPAIETIPQDRAATPWLHAIISALRQRWWLPLAGMAVMLVATLIWLRQTDYRYTAQLPVYAAPSSSGSRAPTALGGLAALTNLAGGTSETVTPFRFYLDGLYSPAVAERLAADKPLMHALFPAEWDAATRQWRRPPSLFGAIRRGVTGIMGLPQFGWTPPGPERLQDYIADAVKVRQSVRTPIVTISYENADPAFAVAFLAKLHQVTDAYLREQQTRRTRDNIAYLEKRLQTVTLTEQRAALVTQLTEQERQAMLAYSNAAYAAEPFDSATASVAPTRPRPIPLLIGAAIFGLLLGAVAAVVWRRRVPATDRV